MEKIRRDSSDIVAWVHGQLDVELAALFRAAEAEIERLRDLVESAYREGWKDGFENDAHSQDRNWKSSHAFRALERLFEGLSA